MGAAGSSEVRPAPTHGVGVNPRLEYATNHGASKGQNALLDAPSLVKLQHGTVRYRYLGEGQDQQDVSSDRIEKPHEGPERQKKHGYFYHSKLNDFSDYSDPSKEESWKFCYVYKGADRARQKQLYYVFGKGLKTNEQGFIEPKYNTQEEKDSEKFCKYHGHMYYDLEYISQDHELPQKIEEVQILGDSRIETDRNEVQVVVQENETVQKVKRKLAVKMFKPATHFHLFQYGEELDRDEEMSTYKPRAEPWTRFQILLKPKGPIDHRDVS